MDPFQWIKGVFGRGDPERDARRAFAESLIAAVAALEPSLRLVYHEAEFVLADPADPGGRSFLGNIFSEYRKYPPEVQAQAVQRFARSLIPRKMAPDFATARAHLLPMVRGRDYFESGRLQLQAEGKALPGRPMVPVGDHIVATVAYDFPDSMAAVDDSMLAGWGVPAERAMEVALENLGQLSQKQLAVESPGLFVSGFGDNHDAARLLLIGSLKRLAVRGELVAAVPTRDRLLVTGSQDGPALARMLELVKEGFESPRFISGIPHVLRGGLWEPFRVPEQHPSFNELLLQEKLTWGQFYGGQKALLDKLHERSGQDVFVSTCSITRNDQTGRVRSHCVWTKDVAALLPRTDLVFFVDVSLPEDRRVVARASWERTLELAGDRMTPVEGFPPRWRVHGFPDAGQLARMQP